MSTLLSPKQLALINSRAPVTLAMGSIRSGKTFSQLIAFALWIKQHAPRGPLAIIGVTRDTINRNILEVLDLIDPRICEWTVNGSTCKIWGRTVHRISSNDTKAESKIRGLTLAGALVDEATLLHEAMFVQLLGRLSVRGAQLFATTNPDGPAHWLKRSYIDRADHLGWRVINFTMADNPSLEPEFIEAKAREFTGLWYRRFILGEWVSAKGAIFPMWEPDRHIIPDQDLPEMRASLGIGVDYGTTNATSAIALTLGVDGRLYAVDEWRVDQAEQLAPWTDAQLAAGLRLWRDGEGQHPGPVKPFGNTFVDPAAASFKAELRRTGYQYVRDANNHVHQGIQRLAQLLATGRLLVSEKCAGLISEIPGYSWDDKAQKRGKDQPIKTADHSIDALRYAIMSTEPWWRPHIDPTL